MYRTVFWSALALVVALAPSVRAADEPKEKDKLNVAHIRLQGDMEEIALSDDPLFGALGLENFRTRLDRIKKAKDDPKIGALYLEIDHMDVGMAKIEEFRRAIQDVKKAGKKTYAYLDSGSVKEYLIACACDEVCMPEGGMLLLVGIRSEMMFYKDLLDKIGVKADMLQMGDFKGAGEPMTRSEMSKELRQQMESVLKDYFENDVLGAIADSRKKNDWTKRKVETIIDDGPFTSKSAHKLGLIDRIAYDYEVQNDVKKQLKADKVEFVKNYGKPDKKKLDLSNPFALFKLLAGPDKSSSDKDKIAVIYATGPIIDGKGGEGMFGGQSCGSHTMVEAIRKAEKDKTVKAIVLRVDSPGGSALASELICKELQRCKKPVVASMSDVAASGGYYISMGAQKVYAEPGTLTGSIGVIGGKLVLGGLYDKIGVKPNVISYGKNAGVLSGSTPFTDGEKKAMMKLMREIYDQFLNRVVTNRKKAGKDITLEKLEKDLAGGRIWTGRQAKEHGLVDELGTLDDAIAGAKQMAKLEKDAEVELLFLPKPKSFMEQLFDSKADAKVSVLDQTSLTILKEFPELRGTFRGVAGMLQLRREPVWLMSPYQIEIK